MPRQSPQHKARLAGLLYLIVIVTAFFAEMFVRSSLVLDHDPAATARNIMASQTLYRLGGAADLINLLSDIALAVILYELFKPFDRTVALSAAALRLVADACLIGATFFHFAPLYFLSGEPYLRPLGTDQLQVLALEAIKLHDLGYNICLVFFGVHCLLLGYLIARSGLVPRLIGVFFVATGLCYLVNSFGHLVFPGINLPFYLLLTGLLSETALMLWLLIFGVNVSRWFKAVDSQ